MSKTLLPTAPLALMLLTAALGLSACSGSGADQPTDPYAGGASYPWTESATGSSSELHNGVNYLSDLSWTSASSSWGPVERDTSNGEQAQGDGHPLTIGNQSFAKGLGVHANSELVYTLSGMCSTFTATVGIDGEVNGNAKASVVFQVWDADTNQKLYDSGVVKATTPPVAVSVDVNGVQNLRLVVTDGGNGISYDHADWAEAKVSCEVVAAVANLKATPSPGGIVLNWDASTQSNLAGYQVARAAQAGGPFTTLTTDTLSAATYNDMAAPQGAVSYYQVVAVSRSGKLSPPSSISATRPAAPGFPTVYSYTGIANQPYSVSEGQGRELGGKLYTFGGFDTTKSCCTPTDRAYVYDPALNTWTALTPMPDRGVTNAGMTTDGRFIYYAGGYIADSAWRSQIFGTKAVWRYDPQTNSYVRLPDLPIERAAGQLEYVGGKLHYFGGTNQARTQDAGDHYVLDLDSNAASWTQAAPLPNPRNSLGSAVLNGKIYALGGQYGHDDRLITQASVNVYDPATDTWTALRDLPRARGHIADSTFVLGGRIVVAGGETGHTRAISDVDAYAPATNTWTSLTPLPSARLSGVAIALGNDFIYTGGSYTAGGWRATPSP